MHFTPAPGCLHPRETQPCPGSSCARCPRRGTHRSPGPAPPRSRLSDREEKPGRVGGLQELISHPGTGDTRWWGAVRCYRPS